MRLDPRKKTQASTDPASKKDEKSQDKKPKEHEVPKKDAQASKKQGSENESPEQRAANKLKKKQEKEESEVALEPIVPRKRDTVADSTGTPERPLKRSNQGQEQTGRRDKRKAEEVAAGREGKRTRTQDSLGGAVVSFHLFSFNLRNSSMFFYIRVICILAPF